MSRVVLVLVVVLALVAGCTSTPGPAVTSPSASTPASTPVSTPASGTPTPTAATPPPPPPPTPSTEVVAWPAPPSGPAFEATRWEEPTPPRADLITVSPGGDWQLHVVGVPGAVKPNADVLVSELGAGRGALTRSVGDGSFSAVVTGGEGAWVMVGTLPLARTPRNVPTLGDRVSQAMHVEPSTYVRASAVPAPVDASGDRAFAVTGHVFHGPVWRFSGRVTDAGSSVRVHGVFRMQSAADRDDFEVRALLSRVFDANGSPIPLESAYATADVTPSGFALERLTAQSNPASGGQVCHPSRESASTLRCDVDLSLPTAGLPPGAFLVRAFVPLAGDPGWDASPPADALGRGARNYEPGEGVPLTLLARGLTGPLKPATLLLVDAPAQGARGVQPQGADWGWSSRIEWQPALAVYPRSDATGAPIRYTFEPYLPQALLADRDSPGPLPFAPSGGTWTVTIRDPNGAETKIGPASFKEIVSRTASTKDDQWLNHGGGNVNGVARLATLDDAFAHAFAVDGLHRVTVKGAAEDADGNVFVLDGVFDVLVAEPLDLDPGMLPGTPLAVGQNLDRAVQVHPGVPADVTYTFREWSGPDASLPENHESTGKASLFGWFHPHAGHPIVLTRPGEYRVDVFANYTDASGKRWAGTYSFGGVVVDPANALDVHGRRGIDTSEQASARFARKDTFEPNPQSGTHFNFPYFSGDVAWQSNLDSMEVRLTVADSANLITSAILPRAASVSKIAAVANDEGPSQDGTGSAVVSQRFAAGQGPLFRATTTGRDASLGDPIALDAYFIGTVEKPGVRVRETAKEDFIPNGYWRFDEAYTLQPGMGPDGDRPNDYKLLFGGAIVRDSARSLSATGGYGALWIELPDGDALGSRVASPFAPASTPLLRFDGKDVRAWYEPTGTRAGSLLVEGDVADFGGYLVPLSRGTLYANVTSPSGKLRALAGESNAWGHVHEPSMNFEVDEPGVWTVHVDVRVCPPLVEKQLPCVSGGLNDGSSSYAFYVASKTAAPLPVKAPAFLQPAHKLSLGADNLVAGHATAWMPGWRLSSREVKPAEALVDYDPVALASEFPNFDRNGFEPGAPADQVTFTALAREASGAWRGVSVDAWGPRVLTP